MILHDAGRDTEARLQLRESLRLREAMPGDHAGLAGDTLRLLGENSAGLGEHATAERQLRRAVSLTREGYGAPHPHALRPELSLARPPARAGGETGSECGRGRREQYVVISVVAVSSNNKNNVLSIL